LTDQEKDIIRILRPIEKELVIKLQDLITKPFNIHDLEKHNKEIYK